MWHATATSRRHWPFPPLPPARRNDTTPVFDILKAHFDLARAGNRAPFPIFGCVGCVVPGTGWRRPGGCRLHAPCRRAMWLST